MIASYEAASGLSNMDGVHLVQIALEMRVQYDYLLARHQQYEDGSKTNYVMANQTLYQS